jgi:hypothetical protein
VLKEKPHLRRCLTKCRHCQILFLTHPRNTARNDLGCPFGCRQVHRRESAIKRSIEYYKSAEGKIKKQYLNARRNDTVPEPSQDERLINSCETSVDATVVLHIQLTISLIEGRAVGLNEVIRMVDRILRQHSFDKRKKMPYRGDPHHAKPP